MKPTLARLVAEYRAEAARIAAGPTSSHQPPPPPSPWPPEPPLPPDQVADAARRHYGPITGNVGRLPVPTPPRLEPDNPAETIMNAAMGSPQLPSALRGRRPRHG